MKRLATLVFFLKASVFVIAGSPAGLDCITFGDADSEWHHGVEASSSEVIGGALGESARRLLPQGKHPWEGGTLKFTIAVDPQKQNYFTIRLWGSETGDSNHLILECEGKQIGYLHLGDIEILDSASDRPPLPGRFFYSTSPLPRALTQGKTSLQCEIRSLGPIWGYGGTFDKYQKPITAPTRGIYRVYTHTDGCFAPQADEKQGDAPKDPPVRSTPGAEAIDLLKEKLSHTCSGLLSASKPLNQHQLWVLARAWHVPWTPAFHNRAVAAKIAEGIDALYTGWLADFNVARNGPAIYNGDWLGLGPAGHAVTLLREPLKPLLDVEILGEPGTTRRAGWSAMFQASRDIHRENRRFYTNQTMINDIYGIYLCNRAVELLEPEKALPVEKALHYLYESAGIAPWLGPEKNGIPLKPLGDGYFQVTSKGLTRELGFVGYYGEVTDWMCAMYEATMPAPGQPGDAKIKAQLEKIVNARAPFRYPGVDADGNRTMQAEAVIGWRDHGHYPGDAVYAQRPTWDGGPLDGVALLQTPSLTGYAQQMLEDNQFFVSVAERPLNNFRVLAGLLATPENYETVKALPSSAVRLPMSNGQPDFVFSDEEDGCVAIKRGDEILYASLYWRARYAVNFLARVHDITPKYDRIAVVGEDVRFEPSGFVYTRPDWTNMGFGNGGLRYPGNWKSAHAGEELPIAKIPEGVSFKPGQENVFAGKGDFYQLSYGPYFIAMNTTPDREFEANIPGDGAYTDLRSARILDPGAICKVAPRSTLVLYRREGK
ncbi:MAG: hypothetical protein ACFUZC_16695 [Chthoniobacteraceae bacterium]